MKLFDNKTKFKYSGLPCTLLGLVIAAIFSLATFAIHSLDEQKSIINTTTKTNDTFIEIQKISSIIRKNLQKKDDISAEMDKITKKINYFVTSDSKSKYPLFIDVCNKLNTQLELHKDLEKQKRELDQEKEKIFSGVQTLSQKISSNLKNKVSQDLKKETEDLESRKNTYLKFNSKVNSINSNISKERLLVAVKDQQKYFEKFQEETHSLLQNRELLSAYSFIYNYLVDLQNTENLDILQEKAKNLMEGWKTFSNVLSTNVREEVAVHINELETIIVTEKIVNLQNEILENTKNIVKNDAILLKLIGTSEEADSLVFFANSLSQNNNTPDMGYSLAKDRYYLYLILLLVVSLYLLWLITDILQKGTKATNYIKNLEKQINHMRYITDEVADGDLSVRFSEEDSDSNLELLSLPLNKMVDNLNRLVFKIRDTSTNLSTSTEQILDRISEQTSTTEEQSKLLRETAVAMEELVQTSAKIADNSNEVTTIAQKTLENVQKSAKNTRITMNKMDAIVNKHNYIIEQIMILGKEINKIHSIMDFINNVADQTKIIGFNAALEATDSQSGLRFGVVATEIRRLADNIIEQTAKISNMISNVQDSTNHLIVSSEESTKEIHQGYEYTEEVARSMEYLIEGAEKTTLSAQQINLATQQQKIASQQILESLKQIDSAASFALKTSEDTREVFFSLKDVSVELIQVVKKFKLSKDK